MGAENDYLETFTGVLNVKANTTGTVSTRWLEKEKRSV
jgi:hypothetical protein